MTTALGWQISPFSWLTTTALTLLTVWTQRKGLAIELTILYLVCCTSDYF